MTKSMAQSLRRPLLAIVFVAAGAQLAAVMVSGCTSLGGLGGTDASSEDKQALGDAALLPHLVIVNALDQSLGALKDDDIRVCLGNTATDRPLPDDPTHPMPLSNYAGIPLGGGVDLGAQVASPTTIYLISATLQDQNYPGAGANEVSCDRILGTGAKSRPFLTVAVPQITDGFNHVLVLLDGPGEAGPGTGVTAAVASLDDATYGPSDAGPVAWAQVGAFGPWARQSVTAELVDTTDGSAVLGIGAFNGDEASAPPSVALDLSTYVDRSLRFTAAGAVPPSFEQTFQAIQGVSDPTTSPSAFYGVRANFLFLVLGAPSASATDAGADAAAPSDAAAPAFGGRALHVVAIPYVP